MSTNAIVADFNAPKLLSYMYDSGSELAEAHLNLIWKTVDFMLTPWRGHRCQLSIALQEQSCNGEFDESRIKFVIPVDFTVPFGARTLKDEVLTMLGYLHGAYKLTFIINRPST